MLQTRDILHLIDERHVRFLSRHQQMVLAGLYLAVTAKDMAEALGCSEPTILRVRRKAMEDVFDLTEIDGTPERLRLWTERHWACCTAAAREMIENSQLLIDW